MKVKYKQKPQRLDSNQTVFMIVFTSEMWTPNTPKILLQFDFLSCLKVVWSCCAVWMEVVDRVCWGADQCGAEVDGDGEMIESLHSPATVDTEEQLEFSTITQIHVSNMTSACFCVSFPLNLWFCYLHLTTDGKMMVLYHKNKSLHYITLSKCRNICGLQHVRTWAASMAFILNLWNMSKLTRKEMSSCCTSQLADFQSLKVYLVMSRRYQFNL